MAFTFFFRDAEALGLAVEAAMPVLCGRAFIHIWDAGCAHGPEPYTLAILLRERMSDYLFRNVHIHATDIDGGFAEKITAGVFPEQEVQRVPHHIRNKYFRPAAPGYVEVVAELRARVCFAQHDLLSLVPIRDGLSMVVCKNVLLHFAEPRRVEVLRMFQHALQPGGVLVMEHTQRLPQRLRPHFQQLVAHAQVYRKRAWPEATHQAESLAPPQYRRGESGRPAAEPIFRGNVATGS
jgi:chemotaxis protein methyltransferase CheR